MSRPCLVNASPKRIRSSANITWDKAGPPGENLVGLHLWSSTSFRMAWLSLSMHGTNIYTGKGVALSHASSGMESLQLLTIPGNFGFTRRENTHNKLYQRGWETSLFKGILDERPSHVIVSFARSTLRAIDFFFDWGSFIV